MSGGGTANLGGGIAQCQAVGGGTARIPNFYGFEFWLHFLSQLGSINTQAIPAWRSKKSEQKLYISRVENPCKI